MKSTHRRQWKPLALLATVLTLAVVSCVLISTRQKRKPFVGLIDPNSGYRCRFTVASDWDCDDTEFSHSVKWLDNDSITPPPPSPVRKWILEHLFHQSDSEQIEINLFSTVATNGNAYADLKNETEPSLRHLRIDGYPATVLSEDEMLSGERSRTVSLFVSVPECNYEVTGRADGADIDRMDSEMQAIISSFHVDRVAVPTDSER